MGDSQDRATAHLELLEQSLSEYANVSAQAEGVPDRLRQVFTLAVDSALDIVSKTLSEPDLEALHSSLSDQRQKEVDSITGLHQKGLLSDVQRDDALRGLFEHPDYAPLRLIEVARQIGHGSLTKSTQVEEVDIPSQPVVAESRNGDSAEMQREVIKAQLTVMSLGDRTELKVGAGSRAKRIPLSRTNNESQKDYTEERLTALDLIISAKGQEVSITQLIEALENKGLVADRNSLGQARSWITKIVFYDQPLIIHNGKRGSASAYKVNPNFDVSLDYRTVETPKTVKTSQDLTTPDKKTRNKVEMSLSEVIRQGGIPLREASILASRFSLNPELLLALGIPKLDSTINDGISKASNEADKIAGITRPLDPNELDIEIKKAASEFKGVFEDEALFDQLINSIATDSPLYPFMNYLLDLNDKQWSTVLNQLLEAKTSTVNIDNESRQQGAVRIFLIELPNGKVFKKIVNADRSVNFQEQETGRADNTVANIGAVGLSAATAQKETARESEPQWLIDLRNTLLQKISSLIEAGIKDWTKFNTVGSTRKLHDVVGKINIISFTAAHEKGYINLPNWSGNISYEVKRTTEISLSDLLMVIATGGDCKSLDHKRKIEKAQIMIEEEANKLLEAARSAKK